MDRLVERRRRETEALAKSTEGILEERHNRPIKKGKRGRRIPLACNLKPFYFKTVD
jgi:hypothetical protein